MTEYFLANGSVIDGSGSAPFSANVLVREDRIAEVGNIAPPAGVPVLDCSGQVIAPGFIDSHTHSDLQVIEGRREKLRQGVTTEVIGNCGFSAYPPAQNPAELRQFANGIFCGDEHWGWPSTQAYLDAIEHSRTANVVSLVGHGALRIAVAGARQGRLSESEMSKMEGLLDEALQAGATGLSTGLMYAPGSSAPTDELVRLCKVVAKRNKIYTSHIRTYFGGLVAAIEEQVDLTRQSGCRLQISHLQAVGAKNWPQHSLALAAIEKAHNEGIDLEFDCYPYVAGSSVLTQLLPQSALDGGTDVMLARLTNPTQRKAIAEEAIKMSPWRWSDIYISSVDSAANAVCIGKNLEQLSAMRHAEPMDVAMDLIVEERGAANMICFNQSEDNLRLSLSHPLATIISDGFYVKGRSHPRLQGTFPLLLGTMCRQRKWLSLPDAIHKITGRPAVRYQLKDRGFIKAGAMADITIFNSETVDSPGTYEDPDQRPIGIHAVFLRGKMLEGPQGMVN